MTLFRNKRPVLQLLTGSITSLVILLSTLSIALAAPPTPPQIFYGNVTVAGNAPGAGATVVAKVGTVQLGSAITNAQSLYNFAKSSDSNPASGSTIDFYVNGVKAAQTSTYNTSAFMTEVNLTTSSAGTVALTIATSSLSGGTSETSYSQTLQAAGGTSPYTWSLAAGSASLPAGLSINASTGAITGTPTTAGSYTFTVKVADTLTTYTQSFTIVITAAQTTTTAQPVTVSTNVLGTAGSFSISSGTVSSATSIGSSDGSVGLSIASNTAVNLQGSQQLTLTRLVTSPTPPAGAKMVSAYSCGPENATFNPALTLTIKYNPADIPAGTNESSLYIATLNGTDWLEIPSTVNTQSKTVTAQLTHFSTYALLGRSTATTNPSVPSTPPVPVTAGTFTFSDLVVTPESAAIGDEIVVTLRVVNSSSINDSRSIILKVNDKNEAQEVVNLAPGKSQVVSFTLSKKKAGVYRTSVEGLNASFEVTSATSQGNAQPVDFSLIIVASIFGAGLLLMTVLIVLVVRRR